MFVGIHMAIACERAGRMALRSNRGVYIVEDKDGYLHTFLACHGKIAKIHATVGAKEDGSPDIVWWNSEKE